MKTRLALLFVLFGGFRFEEFRAEHGGGYSVPEICAGITGLTVIVHEDHKAPIGRWNTWYQ